MDQDLSAIRKRWAFARAVREWASVPADARKRLLGDLDDSRYEAIDETERRAFSAAAEVLEALAADPRVALLSQLVDDVDTLLQRIEK